MDAGGTADNAGSVTVYDPDRPFSPDNSSFATLLQADVMSVMNAQGWQIPNEGVQPDGGFGSAVGDPATGGRRQKPRPTTTCYSSVRPEAGYFSTPSQMPGSGYRAALYLTDPFEGSIAASAADQQVIAQGIATAVEQYFAPPAKSG